MLLRINERIKKVVDAQNARSLNQLSKEIGISQSSLFKTIQGDTEPKFSLLERLLVALPFLSAEWLMRGVGEMMRKDCAPIQNNSVNGNNNIVGHNNTLTSQTENEELVRLRTENEYLRGEINWLRYLVAETYKDRNSK